MKFKFQITRIIVEKKCSRERVEKIEKRHISINQRSATAARKNFLEQHKNKNDKANAEILTTFEIREGNVMNN